jgi:hypothetical protein
MEKLWRCYEYKGLGEGLKWRPDVRIRAELGIRRSKGGKMDATCAKCTKMAAGCGN